MLRGEINIQVFCRHTVSNKCVGVHARVDKYVIIVSFCTTSNSSSIMMMSGIDNKILFPVLQPALILDANQNKTGLPVVQ